MAVMVTGGSSERELSYALARVCRVYRDFAGELLAPLGLHLGQNRLLQELWGSDGLSPSELSGRLEARLSTVTRMVERMEKTGFVERRPSPTDARATQVFLTDRGRDVEGPVKEYWAGLEGCVTAGFSLQEREELRRLLWKVYSNITSAGVKV